MTRARNISNPQAITLPLTVSANITTNASIVVGNSTINTTAIAIGNVSINTISYSVGNSTVNTSIHATAISTNGTLAVGNTTITGTQFVNGAVTFANSTANSIYFAANGNVGIGNNTPNTSLSIKSIDAAITLFGTRGSGAAHYIETSSTNNENLAIRADTELYLSTNGGDRIIAVANGNVGIANATPAYKLQVDGSVGLGGTEAQNRLVKIGQGEGVYLGGTNINTINVANDYDADYTLHLNYNGYNQGTSRYRNLEIDDGKRNRIVYVKGSTGRVGIGTSDPATQLDVNGHARSTYLNNGSYITGYLYHDMSYPNCYNNYFSTDVGTMDGSSGIIEIIVWGQHRSGGSCGGDYYKRFVMRTGDLGIRTIREYSSGSDNVRTNFIGFADTYYSWSSTGYPKTLRIVTAPSNCGCDFTYWWQVRASYQCFTPNYNYSPTNHGTSNPSIGT